MESTLLSTILNRMNRYQDVSTVEEQYKVRDIDEAIRSLRRTISPPWTLKQTTLKVFDDVLIYPVESDYRELALLDIELDNGEAMPFYENARFVYTSLKQFYEDQNPRNKLCEIWDGSTKYIGVRFDRVGQTSSKVSGNTVSDYTATDDASTPFEETVITRDNANSVGFTVTSSSGTATMTEAMSSFSDGDYKKKYYFRWVYLDAAPTSIELRIGNDTSNYLSSSVTTQFSGQAFKADAWNLLAISLNDATETGTLDSTVFDYAAVILTGASSGTYYLNNAYLRGWTTMDYWYYSSYNIKTSSASLLDQNYFYDPTTEAYSTDDSLVGESEWIDVVTFDAILTTLADNRNKGVIDSITQKRREAWQNLVKRYPDMGNIITTQKYNFGNSPQYDTLADRRSR